MKCECVFIVDEIRYIDSDARCLITGAVLPEIAQGEKRVMIMKKPDGTLYARVFIGEKVFYNTHIENTHENRHFAG